MRPPLKLNAIEQEHLQELYDAAGVPRDQLPYSDTFEQFIRDFQDRTFKNADAEQVYAALLKYTRSSTNASGDIGPNPLDPEKTKQLKGVVKKHGKAGKLLPHSAELESARKDFANNCKIDLSGRDFWMAILHAQGRSRRPPPRKAKVKVAAEEDEGEDDGE